MRQILDLDLKEEVYFLPKDMIEYPELTILEVRLLLVLSTKNGLTVDSMDCNTKMWVVNSNNYTVKKLKELEESLINKMLINADGTGLELKANGLLFFIIHDIEKIESCKNFRQVIFNVFNSWFASNIILSVSTFKGIFGDIPKIINKNLKRTAEQTGYNYTWVEKHNKIYIHPVNKIDNGLNEEKIKVKVKKSKEVKKEVEVVEEEIFDINTNDNVMLKQCLNLGGFKNSYEDSIPEPNCPQATAEDLEELMNSLN